MGDYFKLQHTVLNIQEKHSRFFISTCTSIMDYVELMEDSVPAIKFKNHLPQEIMDDFLLELEKFHQ